MQGCLPAQMGQPAPFMRLAISARHACGCAHPAVMRHPVRHSHHALCIDEVVKSAAVRLPLRVGCHCLATSGMPSARVGCSAMSRQHVL